MSKISKIDRQDISSLYGNGSSITPPSNLRDASGVTWKKPPTAITTPTNNTSSGARNSNRPFDPYRGRLKDTLSRQSANPTASKTFTSHIEQPRKKQKMDHTFHDTPNPNPVRHTLGKSKGQGSSKRGVILAPDDVINVDEEEDLGQPVKRRSSVDELNIISSSPSVPNRLNDKPQSNGARPSFGDQGGSADPSAETRLAGDGPSTNWLKSEKKHQEAEDLDPIEDFGLSHEQPSRVRKMVHKIESQAPRLDLRIMQSSIKNSMKPRHSQLPQNTLRQRDLVATSSSFATMPVIKTMIPPKYLPIHRLYLGFKVLDEEPYLEWEERDAKIIIRCGKYGGRSKSPPVILHVSGMVDLVKYVDPDSTQKEKITFPVLSLETHKREPSRNFYNAYSGFFEPGASRGKGRMVFEFDSTHRAWSVANYDGFIKFIKKTVDKKEVIRGKALTALLELVRNQAELGAASENRRNDSDGSAPISTASLKRPASDSPDDEDRTPPPVSEMAHIENHRSESPEKPSSSTVPRPRPLSKGSRNDSAGPSQSPRRSTRQMEIQRGPRSPSIDPDEVILVYPPGATGAVNITNADVNRLQPGEFLNDTLIEFGLKLWLRELEEKNPELAKQIHVFSSFFYKKLNKKNFMEGYESVRKWTSKFNLFKKKYIIVPINENLHWYLAIIYLPEHVLLPPTPIQSPSTRRRAHLSNADKPSSIRNNDERPITPPFPTADAAADAAERAEVEKDLYYDFNSACSITVTVDGSSITTPASSTKEGVAMVVDNPVGQPPSPLPPVTNMEVDDDPPMPPRPHELSPSASDFASDSRTDQGTVSAGPSVHDMSALDVREPTPGSGYGTTGEDSFVQDDTGLSTTVEPSRFYGKSNKAKGKRKADLPPDPNLMDVEDDGDPPIASTSQHAYIFTLDSLGPKHPQVLKNLSRYLKMEAQDKLGNKNTSEAIGKRALVPVQPNYCDCGIYLLHLAQTFMTDPTRYAHIITRITRKPLTMAQRQTIWHDASVGGMRETLAERIASLSRDWRVGRVAKEEAKRREEAEVIASSDSDIDIVETMPAPQGRGKAKMKSTPAKSKANRLR